jgi:hypothetical protein
MARESEIPVAAVGIEPVGEENRQEVVYFLHEQMEPSRDLDFWRRVVSPPWPRCGPNEGFALRAPDRGIVGVYIAYYSELEEEGDRRVPVCNLGTWCVLPEFRLHSLKLLKRLLGQEGYLFTDFTPSQRVVSINSRLGFEPLSGTKLRGYLTFPQLRGLRGARVLTGEQARARLETSPNATPYAYHAGIPGIEQVVITDGDEDCHVIYRRSRRHGIPLAVVLYVSNRELLVRHRARLGWFLLFRRGVPAVFAERRVALGLSWLSKETGAPRLRMVLGDRELAERVDYRFSELTCLPN